MGTYWSPFGLFDFYKEPWTAPGLITLSYEKAIFKKPLENKKKATTKNNPQLHKYI